MVKALLGFVMGSVPAWVWLVLFSLAGAGAGWTANGWRLGAALAECQADASKTRADTARAALAEMQKSTASMAQAASDVAAAGRRAADATDVARRRWQGLVAQQPLPADCRRGAARAAALAEAAGR